MGLRIAWSRDLCADQKNTQPCMYDVMDMPCVSFGNGYSGSQVGINYGSISLPAGRFHEGLCLPDHID